MDMKEKYETLSLAVLKDVAKARGLKGTSTLKKSELIDRLLEEDRKTQNTEETETEKTESVREVRREHEHTQRRKALYWSLQTWTAVSPPTGFWKSFQTAMDLSAVKIIFRGRMMFMCLHPRFVNSD